MLQHGSAGDLLETFTDALFAGITMEPLGSCRDVRPIVQKGFAVLVFHAVSLKIGVGAAPDVCCRTMLPVLDHRGQCDQ